MGSEATSVAVTLVGKQLRGLLGINSVPLGRLWSHPLRQSISSLGGRHIVGSMELFSFLLPSIVVANEPSNTTTVNFAGFFSLFFSFHF